MPSPLFEFFEVISDELSTSNSKVITYQNFQLGGKNLPLLDGIIKAVKAGSVQDAIHEAISKLKEHFETKGSNLPFEYEPHTGRFTTVDPDFLSFVNDMREIRSKGKSSREFECVVTDRFRQRAIGAIHRVGHPRDRVRSRSGFNRYLKTLGFNSPVAYGRDKDGGLDILWLLPIGTIPHRPIVSIQCKNGEFSADEAHKSVGVSDSSFARHAGLQQKIYVPCVLFNDYISAEILGKRPMGFVPLGLTDLAVLKDKISVKYI